MQRPDDRGLMMNRVEEVLVQGSEEELQELKAWLFRENIRLEASSKKLKDMEEQFLKEKVQFQEEMKALNRKMAGERQRLKEPKIELPHRSGSIF